MNYSPELLAAVAVLDQDQPGWWRKINLETFALDNGVCVLAQVYGGTTTHDMLRQANSLMPNTPGGPLIFCRNNYRKFGQPDTKVPDTNTPQWRALISERNAADRIGETLAIPYPESEAVEGYEALV